MIQSGSSEYCVMNDDSKLLVSHYATELYQHVHIMKLREKHLCYLSKTEKGQVYLEPNSKIITASL